MQGERVSTRKKYWVAVVTSAVFLMGTAASAWAAAQIPVPHVLSMLSEDAVAHLETAGLKAKILRDRVTTVAAQNNRVYQQDPMTNKVLPAGGEVVLHVYKLAGPPESMTRVPQVLEKALPQAREMLQKAGLGEVKLDYWVDNKKEMDNKVVFQFPLPGHMVLKGTKVELLVSKYDPNIPRQLILPNLVGKPLDQAVETLEKAGLKPKLHDTKRVTHDKQRDGTVASQSPPQKRTVRTGDTVTLYAYQYQPPPPMVVVPEVVGKPLREAQAILARAGLRAHSRSRRPTPHGMSQDSTVVMQMPEAGSKAAKGALVSLTLDSARTDVLPGLRPDKWVYAPGENIGLAFSMPREWAFAGRVDLLSADPAGQGGGAGPKAVIASQPLRGRESGRLSFAAPKKPGRYEFRLYMGGKQSRRVATVEFEIAISR